MLSSLFFILIGSIGLFFGSEWLVEGSKNIAKKFNISDLAIGLTVVSVGTSAPELIVGLISAFQGYTDFVLGNVLGSNIANIGLAIGLPALFFKIKFDLNDAIMPFAYNIFSCLILYIFLFDNTISFSEAQSLILVFFIYIIASFLRPNITSCDGELENEKDLCLKKAVLRIVGGSAMLYYGSLLFVDNGAIPLVEVFGFSEKAIGMTVVAIGTSLPELFVTLMALYKKEVGISLGNIIGSNIFNILFVLSTISLISPIEGASNVIFELFLGVVFLLFLMLFIFIGKGLNKAESLLLILGYFLFLYFQF